MACPFLEDAIDEEAALLRRDLHTRQEIILRLLLSLKSLRRTLSVTNVTHCGRASTYEQVRCVALLFFFSQSGVFIAQHRQCKT